MIKTSNTILSAKVKVKNSLRSWTMFYHRLSWFEKKFRFLMNDWLFLQLIYRFQVPVWFFSWHYMLHLDFVCCLPQFWMIILVRMTKWKLIASQKILANLLLLLEYFQCREKSVEIIYFTCWIKNSPTIADWSIHFIFKPQKEVLIVNNHFSYI